MTHSTEPSQWFKLKPFFIKFFFVSPFFLFLNDGQYIQIEERTEHRVFGCCRYATKNKIIFVIFPDFFEMFATQKMFP